MIPDEAAPLDLITVRGKKGVSLRDISEATKINVHYLKAIEDGKFSALPGGIYSVSYIRQYARAIDYNESELVELYNRAMGLVAAETSAPVRKKSFFDLLRPVIRVFN
jgi:cytoskeletal protein RodZ